MEFYYIKNNQQIGPVDIESMKGKITPCTKVWHVGMADWQNADQVEALKELFQNTPPTISQQQSESLSQMPKTWLTESILVTIFCCQPFGIVGIVYAAKIEADYVAGRIEMAECHSRLAKRWTIAGFITGLSVLVVYFIIILCCAIIGQIS